jgi:hypothetical protein
VSGKRKLDWPAILDGLGKLHRENPQVLARDVLVGGAACMFYRDQLEHIIDPDFGPRSFRAEEEEGWLSHDVDFATTDPGGVPRFAGDIPLGTLQMGLSVHADEFKENARSVELIWRETAFSLKIADPLDLWREKEHAVARLSRSQDLLHLEVLESIILWEVVHYGEKVASGELSFERWCARAEEINHRWKAFWRNQKLRTRLLALNVPEITSFVRELEQ